MPTSTIVTSSEIETTGVGRELAADLSAGSVVLLMGDLGAGKTAMVRGLAEGLGIPAEDVSSPTFTLMQEYRGGRVPLFHVDLYRLNDAREVEDLGLDEIAAGGVLAIEWAERFPHPPADSIRVTIEHTGDSERRVTIEGQRAKGRGQRANDRGQRAKGRGQRANDKGQRANDKGQRANDKGQKTDG
jgi:tRNA threonylcarbamoyladenosine biosynthesis protein TsaE